MEMELSRLLALSRGERPKTEPPSSSFNQIPKEIHTRMQLFVPFSVDDIGRQKRKK
jgi:hypothetical protein